MNFRELCEEYRDSIIKARKAQSKLGELIANTLKDIIPDIEYALGWNIDTLYFRSDLFASRKDDNEHIPLDELIDDFIYSDILGQSKQEQLGKYDRVFFIDCMKGIYLTDEEAEEIRKRLNKLLEEE